MCVIDACKCTERAVQSYSLGRSVYLNFAPRIGAACNGWAATAAARRPRARRRVLDRGSVLMAAHRPPARTTLPQPRVSRGAAAALGLLLYSQTILWDTPPRRCRTALAKPVPAACEERDAREGWTGSPWCALPEARLTRSTPWTGMRCAAFCSGRPRGSAAPTCSGCGMRTSSSPSGVPGAAGWSHERQRSCYVRATTSWARTGRGRWRQLVDARAPGPGRAIAPHAKNASVLVRGSGSTMNRHTHRAK